ncbi:HET-E [Ganoderma leucocontextum]|nr:HET-E [Ganoderma leucocontextum]
MRTDTPDPLGHEGRATSFIASPDSKWIATASEDETIVVWDAECGTIVQEWVAHQDHQVNDLAFSPDSRHLVSAARGGWTTAGTLAVWDISNGVHKAATLGGHTDVVTTCAWSPDGALIASGSKDGTMRVWDAQTFQQRDPVFREDAEAVGEPPESLQFSPDTSYLAWRRNRPGRCSIWRPLAEEQLTLLLSNPSGRDVDVNALSFDPESRRIATAHGTDDTYEPQEECVVRIWDVATGAALAVLAGHSACVSDVSFAPDGRFLLSASVDRSTKIWDADSWEETASLEEDSAVYKACFSPDGKYIATGSANATVRLWRTSDASCAAVFTEHTYTWRFITHLAFSPDGQFLASGDDDWIVHIRRLSDFIGH